MQEEQSAGSCTLADERAVEEQHYRRVPLPDAAESIELRIGSAKQTATAIRSLLFAFTAGYAVNAHEAEKQYVQPALACATTLEDTLARLEEDAELLRLDVRNVDRECRLVQE